jgi:hypothetical protein
MEQETKAQDTPGTLGHVKFPLTASFVLALAVIGVTWLFYEFPSQRETYKFGIDAATLAAGVLSAYYVGKSLLQGVQQRDRGLDEAKVATARHFCERWNNPDLAQMKDVFRQIIESGRAHDAVFVENELIDKGKRIVVVEVLNFFEEMALVANMKVADEPTLKRFFCGALKSYHSTLSPWMQKHRASKARPTMWCEIDTLVGRW